MPLPVLEREIGGMLQLAQADFQNACFARAPGETGPRQKRKPNEFNTAGHVRLDEPARLRVVAEPPPSEAIFATIGSKNKPVAM
jgi:hypothetical protein